MAERIYEIFYEGKWTVVAEAYIRPGDWLVFMWPPAGRWLIAKPGTWRVVAQRAKPKLTVIKGGKE